MANPKQDANPQLLVSPEDLSREMAEIRTSCCSIRDPPRRSQLVICQARLTSMCSVSALWTPIRRR